LFTFACVCVSTTSTNYQKLQIHRCFIIQNLYNASIKMNNEAGNEQLKKLKVNEETLKNGESPELQTNPLFNEVVIIIRF